MTPGAAASIAIAPAQSHLDTFANFLI